MTPDPKRTGPIWQVIATFESGTVVKLGFFPAPTAEDAINRAKSICGNNPQYDTVTWKAQRPSAAKHGRAA